MSKRPVVALGARMAKEIAGLQAERARIQSDADAALAAVDRKIAAIEAAQAVVTREIETAYAVMVELGLVREIE